MGPILTLFFTSCHFVLKENESLDFLNLFTYKKSSRSCENPVFPNSAVTVTRKKNVTQPVTPTYRFRQMHIYAFASNKFLERFSSSQETEKQSFIHSCLLPSQYVLWSFMEERRRSREASVLVSIPTCYHPFNVHGYVHGCPCASTSSTSEFNTTIYFLQCQFFDDFR